MDSSRVGALNRQTSAGVGLLLEPLRGVTAVDAGSLIGPHRRSRVVERGIEAQIEAEVDTFSPMVVMMITPTEAQPARPLRAWWSVATAAGGAER